MMCSTIYYMVLHIMAVKVVIERPWLAVDGPFLSFARTCIENTSILHRGFISNTVGGFSPTIVHC